MSNESDIQICARLAVEAAILLQSIRGKHGDVDKVDSEAARIYEKAYHKFYRRAHALDAIVAESVGQLQEICVGKYSENTPRACQRSLITPAWTVINFDISEFEKHQL